MTEQPSRSDHPVATESIVADPTFPWVVDDDVFLVLAKSTAGAAPTAKTPAPGDRRR